MFNWLFNWFFAKRNKILTDHIKALEKKCKELPAYIPIKIPANEDLNRILADLGNSEVFMFYLHTLENGVMAQFTDGSGSDVYRGALKQIKQIRIDMNNAIISQEKKKADIYNV
jgi:hypothetical protein